MKFEETENSLTLRDVPWTSWIVFPPIAAIVALLMIALVAVVGENPTRFFDLERDGVFGIAIGVVMFLGFFALLAAGLYALLKNATTPVFTLVVDRAARTCELTVRGLLRRDRLQYPFAEVCGFRADKRYMRRYSYFVVQMTTKNSDAVDVHTSQLTAEESEEIVRKLEEELND